MNEDRISNILDRAILKKEREVNIQANLTKWIQTKYPDLEVLDCSFDQLVKIYNVKLRDKTNNITTIEIPLALVRQEPEEERMEGVMRTAKRVRAEMNFPEMTPEDEMRACIELGSPGAMIVSMETNGDIITIQVRMPAATPGVGPIDV